MDKVLAIIMAGGVGERLRPLTKERSKSAVPFGEKYRIIVFPLSNCVTPNTRHIYVLTQYRSGSLNQHIQDGWGISSSGLGDYIYCVPAQQKLGADCYRGTADALRQNLDLVKRKDVEHVFILSGDHIYKMNYLQMLAYHRAQNADLTISALRLRREQAANSFGILEVDEDLKLFGFEEKPAPPKTIPNA